MKILQVIAPAAYGGLEKVVQALVCGLGGRGHEVTVGMVQDPDARLEEYTRALSAEGARVVPIVTVGRSYAKERASVAAICREWHPDIIHTHGYRCDVLMASVARQLGLPHVTTVHGFTAGDWKNRLYEVLQRRTFRRLSAVVAVSQRLVRDLAASGVPEERIVLAPNAWGGGAELLTREHARERLGIAGESVRFGWVGRLSREKGPDVLVEALAHVKDLPFEVSYVGDGPGTEGLKDRARALGVGDRVSFHGAVPEAGTLCRAFDFFVLSSRTEGTPIALLEAVAARVPVIATRVGGVPDVVTENEAILVPPEDPRALAAAIRAVLEDRPAAERRAVAAEQRLKTRFALDPWLDRYTAIYEQLRPGAVSRELCTTQS